jgi:hypothetical protein
MAVFRCRVERRHEGSLARDAVQRRRQRGRQRVGRRRSAAAYSALRTCRRRGLGSSDSGNARGELAFFYQLRSVFAMNTLLNDLGFQGFQVRFDDLFRGGRWLAFPCDAHGHVDLDALSHKARLNYLYARAMIGREYSAPSVCPPLSAA